ncbi:MAG: GAF domain-containing SpoIIE family protein phosphatase [Peptostreptococcaceae bacterium]|nr:GAF domain-containing SpoIIE family protein phosphatase [Peptostreptococcaceae bacterium]
MSNDIYKMRNLVEISSMVAESSDFFMIKDKIIEKMLEVVHPTKACVNLFYKNNYKHAYLVCSQTLEKIPYLFPIGGTVGVKIDFSTYPKYIHEAVKEKKIVYVKNVFEDIRAIDEREMAKSEGYVGRIVFPLIVNNIVVGFMTCFLVEEDTISDYDIDFISSVASLIALSIEITTKNNNMQRLVHKLRGAISSINEATKKLYHNKNINEFLDHLSEQACDITNSKEALIIIDEDRYKGKISSSYNMEKRKKVKTDVYSSIGEILSKEDRGGYCNSASSCILNNVNIDTYIYYKLYDKNKVIGCIVCSNSDSYTKDDLNILSILANQVAVGMQLYEYNIIDVKHKLLANELNILNEQQRLIMDKSKMECNNEKELYYYHRPARVVGGDFYYATRVDEDNIVYIVADVMGHGIVSNYVVAMIKGAFKVLCHQYKTPGEIMTNLNKMLYDEFDKMGVFTTCLISVFNTKDNTISVSNAGHYSPIIINNDGLIKRDLNCVKGIPIGILEESEYTSNVFNVTECPMICMFTDGVLEIKNKEKEEYGIGRLEEFLRKNYSNSQEKIVENIKTELKEFASTDSYDDDIMIVMLKNI